MEMPPNPPGESKTETETEVAPEFPRKDSQNEERDGRESLVTQRSVNLVDAEGVSRKLVVRETDIRPLVPHEMNLLFKIYESIPEDQKRKLGANADWRRAVEEILESSVIDADTRKKLLGFVQRFSPAGFALRYLMGGEVSKEEADDFFVHVVDGYGTYRSEASPEGEAPAASRGADGELDIVRAESTFLWVNAGGAYFDNPFKELLLIDSRSSRFLDQVNNFVKQGRAEGDLSQAISRARQQDAIGLRVVFKKKTSWALVTRAMVDLRRGRFVQIFEEETASEAPNLPKVVVRAVRELTAAAKALPAGALRKKFFDSPHVAQAISGLGLSNEIVEQGYEASVAYLEQRSKEEG